MKIIVPITQIVTFVLRDTFGNCKEDLKEDTEALFIDPLYNIGYIVQKVRPRNVNKEPVIFKVKFISKYGTVTYYYHKFTQNNSFELKVSITISISKFNMSSGNIAWIWNGLYWVYGIDIELQRVGYIPSFRDDQRDEKNRWPTFITGGDISIDGQLIILRGYKSK